MNAEVRRTVLNEVPLRIFGLTAIMSFGFVCHAALADNPRGGGLSQLEFDKPVVSTPPKGDGPSEHDIRVILEGGEKKPPDDQPKASPSAAPGMQKLQKFDWVKPSDGQGHFLTPRLRGPQADPQHPTTITTEAKWGKQNGACDVSSADLLCDKARALKELILRFSGDPDFYGRQCQQICADAATQALLTSFKVKDRRGQAYDILQAGEKCRYQLGATSGKVPWLAMEGDGGVCMCLPRGCAE